MKSVTHTEDTYRVRMYVFQLTFVAVLQRPSRKCLREEERWITQNADKSRQRGEMFGPTCILTSHPQHSIISRLKKMPGLYRRDVFQSVDAD